MPDIETIISALQISICVTVDKPSQNASDDLFDLTLAPCRIRYQGREREYRSLWATTREKWTFVFSSNIPFFFSRIKQDKRGLCKGHLARKEAR